MTITRIVPMSPRVRIAGAEKLTVANLQVQVAPEYSTYTNADYNAENEVYAIANLAVRVTDADGAPVRGLPRSAFHVWRLPENDTQPWHPMELRLTSEIPGPPGGWADSGFYLVQFYPYVDVENVVFGTEIGSVVYALTVRGRVRTPAATVMGAGVGLFSVARFTILSDDA